MTTNYAVAPGEYLEEWLEESALTQQQLADRLGCSRKQVNEIVNGRAPVTIDTALRLERVTCIPADSWLRYEVAYRGDLTRLRDHESLAEHAQDIDPRAAAYLRAKGYTQATMRNPGQLVSDFLAFHRCGTFDAYVALYESQTRGEYALATLKESRLAADLTAVTTWLRAGELTRTFETWRDLDYHEGRLRTALPRLRERCSRPDADMASDVSLLLAEAGVLLLFVEPPASFPLYGITRWIDGWTPLIQQTGRRSKDGFLVWTLFHEIGHVLNDPRGELHYEYATERTRTAAAEKQANAFAMQVLFGHDGITPFRGLTRDRDIADVARGLGIAPGVAVHQLHSRRELPYEAGNRLLRDIEIPFSD